MFRPNTTNTASILTDNFFPRVRWASFAGLMTLLMLLALNAPLLAQGRNRATQRTAQDETILIRPLARDDMRAQLDPQLRNALPMPGVEEVEFRRLTARTQEPMTVELDLATGEEQRAVGQAAALALRGETEALQMSGYVGPQAQAEDNEQDSTRRQLNLFSPGPTICQDDQIVRHDTSLYPWSTQVKLYMTFPNGGVYVGSGTMIGSKYVITHQNNLYYPAFGGWATRVEAVPGLDGYYMPFLSARAVHFRYYADGAANIGLITLGSNIGSSTGWLGCGSFSDSFVESYTSHLAGYPAGDYNRLYYGYNLPITQGRDWLIVKTLFHTGELGTGIYLKNSAGERFVHSVATNYYSDARYKCFTSADRVTSWILSQVRQVMLSGQ